MACNGPALQRASCLLVTRPADGQVAARPLLNPAGPWRTRRPIPSSWHNATGGTALRIRHGPICTACRQELRRCRPRALEFASTD
eukprot:CAMPEP_0204564936 /NCGR_PEP_ID=MMETSP0661-20131031/35181_1 /ASSEMBLY_ACC=CAM_ASM_000606 /TAXON_ID=109239 /ORGANISM="Alexandrium margalefi, Strain AMGDE01CS-322" /LENGTH=84 /DNA_ID=CAMNT_0051572633 /DNA_START=44 /DNA_END=298 /DNA_ORIENTATION=+